MASCRGCKTEFIPKRKGQEYHNIECYRKSTIRLIKCPQCAKKFKRKFSKQVCCSIKCAFKYRAKKNTKGKIVYCAFYECRKPIYKMPSRIKKYNFCSVAHRADFAKSNKNVDFGKGWKHTPEEIEKIRQASLNRDYDTVLTDDSRKKMAETAHNRIWTNEMRENARLSHLGKITPEEVKKKIIAHAKFGWKNKSWKGRYAGYVAKHIWANRHLKLPKICVECGASENDGLIVASNKNHRYYKKLEDWEWRCVRCHNKYHLRLGLVKPKGKAVRFYM